jgi:hypothetical protein
MYSWAASRVTLQFRGTQVAYSDWLFYSELIETRKNREKLSNA